MNTLTDPLRLTPRALFIWLATNITGSFFVTLYLCITDTWGLAPFFLVISAVALLLTSPVIIFLIWVLRPLAFIRDAAGRIAYAVLIPLLLCALVIGCVMGLFGREIYGSIDETLLFFLPFIVSAVGSTLWYTRDILSGKVLANQ
jgi:flagellar biosynthesis protein FliQ